MMMLVLAPPAFADGTINGVAVDCYCTDKQGQRIEIGETRCLHVDGRMFMAQCQMSLNVPMWREVGEGCGLPEFTSVRPVSAGPVTER